MKVMNEELIREKQRIFQELIYIMNQGLNSEDLTSDVLKELKDRINEMLNSDF
jgi:hypothetical protein